MEQAKGPRRQFAARPSGNSTRNIGVARGRAGNHCRPFLGRRIGRELFALDHPDRTAALALLAPPLYPFARATTWLYALFATPVLGWIYARTLALPLGLPFIGLGLASAFLPQLPPSNYLKRSAGLLLLRPSTFLANARDVADLRRFLDVQVARYPSLAAPTVIMTGDREQGGRAAASCHGLRRRRAGRKARRAARHRPYAASCGGGAGDRGD